jgi:restriction endonuclease S subunit
LSLAHGRGQIKRVHYVTGEFAVANLLAVLQPIDDEKLNAKYLYLALDKVKDELGALMQGTVYVTLKITDLAKYEIPLPPIDIQRALADEYDALQSIIAKNNELISQMEARVRRKLAVMFGDGAESDLKLS